MKVGFAYARVSSKDQETYGNSIQEQISRIQKFAANNEIELLKTFQETGSAYHDETREQFDKLINEAIKHRANCIIVDDSSRFARTVEVYHSTIKLLRRHNVEVLFASEENYDAKSSSGIWVTGIRGIKNEAHSLDIANNTIRGMSGNIKKRDAETGWCYKNGGKAPFGYQIVKLDKGIDSKGKAQTKSIWHLHPENSKVARLIIVDLYIKQDMSYEKIMNYLNEQSIPGPSGDPWGLSTVFEMLRENRLEQYAGTGFWNKENRQTVGKRFNPREEWTIVENAHPAIINQEELSLALAKKEKSKKNYTASRTTDSPYLFTGKNFEGKPFFTCTSCGGNIIGYRSSSRHSRKYICGPARYKGDAGCKNRLTVNQEWLENIIIEEIENRYATPNIIDKLIEDVKADINAGCKSYFKSIDELGKQKKDLESQAKRIVDALKEGISLTLIKDEANKLEKQINSLDQKITYLKSNPPNELNFDEDEIRRFFTSFKPTFEAADNAERKKLIRTFISYMVLDRENKEVRVMFYPDIVHRIGVGDGT